MQTPELMMDAVRTELSQQFKLGASEHEGIHSRVEEAIVRTEWATTERYLLEPLYHELHGLSRGSILQSEPKDKKRRFLHGWDKYGQLRLTRTWYESSLRFGQSSTYVEGERQRLKRWVFDEYPEESPPRIVLKSVGERIDTGDFIVCVSVGTPPNWSASMAEVREGHIVQVKECNSQFPQGVTYDVEYEKGLLSSIALGGRPVYKRPLRPLGEVLKEVKKLLAVRVPSVVAGARIKERVYAIALGFQGDAPLDVLPPSIGVGLLANRNALMQAKGDRLDLGAIWNPLRFEDGPHPSEYPLPGLEQDDLLSLGIQVGSLMAEAGSTEPAVQMLTELAMALNKLDWRDKLDASDDFVVYAADINGGEEEALLRRSVPRAKLVALEKAGLLRQR